MKAAAALELEHVSRRLAGRTIVEALDFGLARGRVLGLLGVNGAGKSTTLRMIAGLLAPSAGSVRVDGVDLAARDGHARRAIGYLPEEPPLYAELTVHEYLRFCARLHGLPASAIDAAVERATERCGLGEMRRRLCGLLSKGFRQRVGIAQAIVHEPALVVLDEPAAGLDPVQALRLRDLVAGLRDAHAVVLSTHVLSDVTACCDEVVILHRGRVRHAGTLAELERDAWLVVRTTRAVEAAEWASLPVVAEARPGGDACSWRLRLEGGAGAGALAAAIGEHGFGLDELRAEHGALEQLFVTIAAEDSIEGKAA
ncbi:MAG: ABC transporter ATP-binding protein [Xanthomonadales bacterium]|nr:ABC transporter ATP-binding protein [Xanthomonadales bacterium]